MKPQQDLSVSEQRFPAGMRVLVVDDDTTCLKLMDKLLRKCQYIVTTTNRAKEALRILKENKNRFDIVISDVEMPDMDGIKLLQLIGLEMNIPVIMLSAYSDTKRVMQGIRNGACDYLVKPVRIQELQNIWQHIVRRNKSMTIRRPRYLAADEDERALVPSNANASSSERRKGKSIQGNSSGGDDDDNDDEEQEDSGRENESTNQKKPRLFWSVELHQKFVDAVDSLGIEKAFPKKILDLMNVEGLTREKVASHLQKYRLYLRKVNSDTNQPPSKISAYDDGHIGPLGGGYGIFRSLAGATGRFPSTNPAMPHPVLLGRLNTAAGLSIRGLASSPMLQSAQVPNSSSSFPPFGKFEPAAPSANPSPALFQSFPSLQSNRGSFLYPQTNTIMTNQNVTSGFGNQASLFVPPSSIGPLGGIGSSATNLLNPNGGLSNWGSSIQPSLQPQAFQQNIFQSNTSGDGIVPQMANIQNAQSDPLDYFGGISSRNELNRNLQAPDRLNGNGINSFNNSGQVPIWQDQRPHYNFESCNMSGGSSSAVPVVAPGDQMMSENETHMSASPFSQLEGGSAQSVQENEVQEGNMKFDDFLIEDPKLIAGASNGGSEYLEDIVGRFLKQDDGEAGQEGEDFDLDSFSV